MRYILSMLILIGIWGAAGNVPAQNVATTYTYTHVDPEVLESTLVRILPDRHQYKLDRSRKMVMVIAPEYVHAQFVPLLEHLDKPVKKISITVEWLGPDLQSAAPPPALEIGDTRETLLALPLPLWRMDWLSREGAAWSTMPPIPEWNEVTAAFSIQPTIVGENANPMIRLLLIPELRGKVNGKPLRVRYTRASMQLFAHSGKPVRLGKYIKEPAFYERFLAGSNRQGQADQRDLVLTPKLIEQRPD